MYDIPYIIFGTSNVLTIILNNQTFIIINNMQVDEVEHRLICKQFLEFPVLEMCD